MLSWVPQGTKGSASDTFVGKQHREPAGNQSTPPSNNDDTGTERKGFQTSVLCTLECNEEVADWGAVELRWRIEVRLVHHALGQFNCETGSTETYA